MPNYRRIYEELCESRQYLRIRPNTRKHYIQPRSLGGQDNRENVVYLTPKEQFVAHRLLTKFTIAESKYRTLLELSDLALSYPAPWIRNIGHKAKEEAQYLRKNYWRKRLSEDHKKAIGRAIFGIRRPGTGPNMWGERNVNWGKFGEKHHTFGKRWKISDTSRYSEARRKDWRKKKDLGN